MNQLMQIAAFFVGEINDRGFNASALRGVENAAAEGMVELSIISGVTYDQEEIRYRILEIIDSIDGLVFIGGQGETTVSVFAADYPDKLFAVIQGRNTGPNLAAYDVQQEESAFLAGVLASMLTQTGIVAHLSGHRVLPGLKGRAAFAAGAVHGDPDVKVLTGFCGTQDDSAITRAWADAQIDAGADVLFTMLNGARQGVIAACRQSGARQIGNALDWVQAEPDVFVASAIARIDLGVSRAIADMADRTTPAQTVELGLVDGDFVSLSMRADVSASVTAVVENVARAIGSGRITVPRHYDGPEFHPTHALCAIKD